MNLKSATLSWIIAAAIATIAQAAPSADEGAIRKLDEEQRRLVAAADLTGLQSLAHPHLRINAPGNRVLTREQFLENLRTGEIAADGFDRTAEDVTITGDIAVVMGRETFTPAPRSELARTYGAVPLSRRYTNVYVLERGRWFWLARHANVVTAPLLRVRSRKAGSPRTAAFSPSRTFRESARAA